MIRASALVLATLCIVIAVACSTTTGDTGRCGSRPTQPPWQHSPFVVECLKYCNDDQSSLYECVNGKWVCPTGQIPVTSCPCGGGFGNTDAGWCMACDGGTASKTCDVTAHAYVCPAGAHDPNQASSCDASAGD